MRDPLEIARGAAQSAVGEGIREDQKDQPSEVIWLLRAKTFALVSIAGSLREMIDWVSVGEDPAAVLGASIASGRPVTVTDDEPPISRDVLQAMADYVGDAAAEVEARDAAHLEHAEPLVTCGEPDGDGEPCVMLPGHEGGHLPYFPVERHPEDPEPTAPPISPRPYVPVPEFLP